MNLVTFGNIEAGVTLATDKHGYEHVLVVAKVTFTIKDDGTCAPSDEQQPLVYADEFYSEPGFSAVKYETDFALFKPKTDVLLNGSAYAPGSKPATRVTVSLQVGKMVKSFNVVGNRYWKRGLMSVSPTPPEPFTVMPITYENAFGGVDDTHKDPAKHRTYLLNHVGKGYYTNTDLALMDGKPLPNTEEINNPITKPDGKYKPMAFGVVGRAWQPRASYAGTYDQQWLDEHYPFLPPDFDNRYFQAAPEDQWCEHLRGGEAVRLVNLTPEGKMAFRLPVFEVPVKLIYRSHNEELRNILDTVIIEPDKRRCILTWRGSTRLKEKPNFLYEIWVGAPSKARLRALETGKRYIKWADLHELSEEI
ncbi:MAG: DUF2169 domain-containing protein [Calditrichaeota bacterium]|nr:MAG: DUF2169 domain-containing protein [Calditrichota bacterium]